jgi:type IV pilus assembly protein PilC
MPQFAYKARRRSGEVIQATLDAPDRTAALSQIERLGLFPVMVDALKGSGASAAPAVPAGRNNGNGEAKEKANVMPEIVRRILRRKRKPKLQELATFTQQMTNLLKCGMPLVAALNSMTHLETKGIPSDVSKQLKQDVMEGRSLSDAMAKQPGIFSDLYVNMVRAGEQSGALVEVLQRLATHFTRFAEVQQKFVAALIYPCIVASVGVVIIIFFMTFMLPKFLTIFEGLKVPLPWATQMLVNISHFFSNVFYMGLAGMVLVVGFILFKRFQATPEGKRKIDAWKMNAPVVGKAIKLNLFGQFARTLGTLLVNGVPVLTALKISEEIMPNVVVKEAIAKTREEVTDGKTIAQPLARSQLFPQLMIDLLKIGEETGDVPGSLNNIAETYENELALALRVMTNLIEPAMIIVMAMGVGGLLFSILSAMFAITSSISR